MILGAVLCAAAAVATLAAQGRFRGGIDLVSLHVTVTDGSRYVTDLEREEFEVFEDGARQEVSFFSKVQQPIALAILLDTSASMDTKLETAQEAAIGFARRLGHGDVMEVIDFDGQVSILQRFTSDVNALERAIRQATVNGCGILTWLLNSITSMTSSFFIRRTKPVAASCAVAIFSSMLLLVSSRIASAIGCCSAENKVTVCFAPSS